MIVTIGRIHLLFPDGTTLFDLPALQDLALPLSERVPGENWRGVPGARGYFASSEGRIWSRRQKDGTMLRQLVSGKTAYPAVFISGRRVEVHAVVARAFLGPRPVGKQVAHSDDVKTNCSVANLRYTTPSGNQLDSVRNGTHANAAKKACSRQGHPFTPENTIIEKTRTGEVRRCRTCRTAQKAGYRAATRVELELAA